MTRPGELESAVLDALWDGGEQSVREVLCRTGSRHAYTTILTVLDRLHDKGQVLRRKVRSSWRYRPARTREEALGRRVAALLEETPGAPRPLLRAFLDRAEELDPGVLDELDAMIRARRAASESGE